MDFLNSPDFTVREACSGSNNLPKTQDLQVDIGVVVTPPCRTEMIEPESLEIGGGVQICGDALMRVLAPPALVPLVEVGRIGPQKKSEGVAIFEGDPVTDSLHSSALVKHPNLRLHVEVDILVRGILPQTEDAFFLARHLVKLPEEQIGRALRLGEGVIPGLGVLELLLGKLRPVEVIQPYLA